MSVARTHPILSSRAVHPPWTDRYVRFKRGDWEAFKAARHTHHHGWMKRAFVDACGGFVIHRSDPNGARLPSYIRPDKAICTWHGRKSVQRRGSKAICGICGGDLSKYTQASKRTTARSGKLIDVHPLLGERLQAGDEPIYFCLEGCLKADAVAGTGGLSISVLSVTLWQADEEPTHWALWLAANPAARPGRLRHPRLRLPAQARVGRVRAGRPSAVLQGRRGPLQHRPLRPLAAPIPQRERALPRAPLPGSSDRRSIQGRQPVQDWNRRPHRLGRQPVQVGHPFQPARRA
jgi:hypothetical protein